jgi:hypothetical protein
MYQDEETNKNAVKITKCWGWNIDRAIGTSHLIPIDIVGGCHCYLACVNEIIEMTCYIGAEKRQNFNWGTYANAYIVIDPYSFLFPLKLSFLGSFQNLVICVPL